MKLTLNDIILKFNHLIKTVETIGDISVIEDFHKNEDYYNDIYDKAIESFSESKGVKSLSFYSIPTVILFLMTNDNIFTTLVIERVDDKTISICDHINKSFNNRLHLIISDVPESVAMLPLYDYDIVAVDNPYKVEVIKDVIRYTSRILKRNGYLIFKNVNDRTFVKSIELENETLRKLRSSLHVYQYEVHYKITTPKVTVVTSLYDIRKPQENIDMNILRTMDKYFQLGSVIFSNLDVDMVIYTEQTFVDKFKQMRSKYLHRTIIIVDDFELSQYYGYKEKLEKVMECYKLTNDNKVKDTSLYTLFGCNKFYWMRNTAIYNPFNSSHFIWMDLGLAHVIEKIPMIKYILENVSDKFKLLRITNSEDTTDYYRTVYHNVSAGMFSGGKEEIIKFCKLYQRQWERLLSSNRWQLDEAVIDMVSCENPNDIDIYYGDYQSLVSNYNIPHTNIDFLINVNFIELNRSRYKVSYDLCSFLRKRLAYHSVYHQCWLTNTLISNWYVNGNILPEYLRDALDWAGNDYKLSIKNNILAFYHS